MKRLAGLAAAVALSAFAVSARGREINGVTLPERIDMGGKSLVLNGAGVRTKTFLGIKVYSAGLYLEKISDDADVVLGVEVARRLVIQMTHNAPRRRVVGELLDGVERNAGARWPALKERLDTLLAGLPELREGNGFSLTYVPGQGTTLAASGCREVTVAGSDFAAAIFGAWLGRNPLDSDLKSALLGAK